MIFKSTPNSLYIHNPNFFDPTTKMNIGGDNMPLIDISSEDHHLIDSHLDRPSFDLRLSIAYDEQFRTPNVERKDEFKSRQSLAWDSAFFTSAGILDLKELSLVNDGFKNPVQNRTSKIFEKGRSRGKLASRESEESFLEFRLSGKQSSKHHPKNMRLPSRTQVQPQMRFVNHQSSTTHQMSSGREQDHKLRPPRVQTRASAHVNVNPVSPKSACSKNLSSAYRPNVSSNPGKRWLSKSLDFKGDMAQLQSSKNQNSATGKRSLSPLLGEVKSSTKNPSRLCMPSKRLGLFEIGSTESAKKVQIHDMISPEPRGSGPVNEHGGSSGRLKKRERKTSSHTLTKKTRSVYKGCDKENMFHVESERFHGGLPNKEYAEMTSLFDGLAIEPKGIRRKKASTAFISLV